MLSLGIIGAFLPVMPTTIFVILAAGAFAKSSPKFEAWILNHPRFGPVVLAWRKNKAMPMRAKFLASAGMALGAVMIALSRMKLQGQIPCYALLLACLLYVWSLPVSARSEVQNEAERTQ